MQLLIGCRRNRHFSRGQTALEQKLGNDGIEAKKIDKLGKFILFRTHGSRSVRSETSFMLTLLQQKDRQHSFSCSKDGICQSPSPTFAAGFASRCAIAA